MLDGYVSGKILHGQIGDINATSHLSEVNRNYKIWVGKISLLQPSHTRYTYSVHQEIDSEEDCLLV